MGPQVLITGLRPAPSSKLNLIKIDSHYSLSKMKKKILRDSLSIQGPNIPLQMIQGQSLWFILGICIKKLGNFVGCWLLFEIRFLQTLEVLNAWYAFKTESIATKQSNNVPELLQKLLVCQLVNKL